jgi:hypothetical protein
MPDRRFPPPWSAEETDACFIVRDANGQQLAYVAWAPRGGRTHDTSAPGTAVKISRTPVSATVGLPL